MKRYLRLIIALIFAFCNTYADYTALYDIVPDINSCTEGKLKSSETQNILDYVNKIRALHKLPVIIYNSTNDIASQKTSLIMASNETLNHFPPASYSCYSVLGKEGAGSSNLYISYAYGQATESSEKSVSSWMVDGGVDVCGHRRWIINPWVIDISYGRVDGKSKQNSQFNVTATNLYYSSNPTKNLSTLENDFVAYPYQEYPKELIYDYDNKIWKFSFTAIQDKSNMWNNSTVNFGNATIKIADESNAQLTISNISPNNQGYGVPNALLWDVSGLQNNKKYTVTISNVSTSGGTKNYTYWFKIIDGWPSSNSLATPVLTSPANKSTNQPNPITLKWNAVANAKNYEIYFDETPSPTSNILVSKSGITSTSFVIDSNLLQPLTKYYWAVRAFDANGNTSSWSGEFNLTTKAANAPSAPMANLPANGAVNVSLNAKFVWNSVKALFEKIDIPQSMITYNLIISKSSDFSTNILDIDVSDTTYTAENGELPPNTKIYWKVRAFNYTVPGNWSSTMNFNTLDPSGIEDNFISDVEEFYNYPNPFEQSTFIVINLSKEIEAQLEIFDLMGNKIMDVYNGKLSQGINKFNLKLNNGSYYCRLTSNKSRQIIKLISK